MVVRNTLNPLYYMNTNLSKLDMHTHMHTHTRARTHAHGTWPRYRKSDYNVFCWERTRIPKIKSDFIYKTWAIKHTPFFRSFWPQIFRTNFYRDIRFLAKRVHYHGLIIFWKYKKTNEFIFRKIWKGPIYRPFRTKIGPIFFLYPSKIRLNHFSRLIEG